MYDKIQPNQISRRIHQKRFCDTHKTNNVVLLSDYKEREFGSRYGLAIKELGLLARAVLVIDPDGKIIHQEVVKEVTQEPDYQAALQKVK